MTNTVILHIGTHKTGSSAIQQSLKNYDDGEVFYCHLDRANHSIPFYSVFSGSIHRHWQDTGIDNKQLKQKSLQYKNEISSQLERPDRTTMIISGEDISVMNDHEKKSLVGFITDHGCDIQLVCYLREPTEFSASAFQQRVKGRLSTVPKLITAAYKRRLKCFQSVLPKENLHVRAFDRKTLQNGCVVQDFISLCNLDASRIDIFNANKSMSLSALKLLFLANKVVKASRGDPVINKTREIFNSGIISSYQGQERIPKNVFTEITDYSEVDFVRDEFGILFTKPNEENIPTRKDLVLMLDNLDDIDTTALDQKLAEFGLDCDGNKLATKLHRYFNAILIDLELRKHGSKFCA